MKKPLVVSIVIIFLVILASGIYFFMRGNKGNDLIVKINKLQTDIVVAKDKLNKEKASLEVMTMNLNTSYPLATSVQGQMRKATDIVNQTNFMFNNPSSLNPELVVKNLLNGSAINEERKNINLLIESWQKKIEVLFVNQIDVKESEKIKQEAQIIKTFIENLSNIVVNLTPANSGLSQNQIDTYIAELPSVDSVNHVISSIAAAIQNYNNTQSGSTGANNTPNLAPVPIVTPNQVVSQQVVVVDTQNQVTILQNQLTQIVQDNPSLVLPPIVNTTPTPAPVPDSQNANVNVIVPGSVDNTNSPGIIIQPGAPRLIEGTNQY